MFTDNAVFKFQLYSFLTVKSYEPFERNISPTDKYIIPKAVFNGCHDC